MIRTCHPLTRIRKTANKVKMAYRHLPLEDFLALVIKKIGTIWRRRLKRNHISSDQRPKLDTFSGLPAEFLKVKFGEIPYRQLLDKEIHILIWLSQSKTPIQDIALYLNNLPQANLRLTLLSYDTFSSQEMTVELQQTVLGRRVSVYQLIDLKNHTQVSDFLKWLGRIDIGLSISTDTPLWSQSQADDWRYSIHHILGSEISTSGVIAELEKTEHLVAAVPAIRQTWQDRQWANERRLPFGGIFFFKGCVFQGADSEKPTFSPSVHEFVFELLTTGLRNQSEICSCLFVRTTQDHRLSFSYDESRPYVSRKKRPILDALQHRKEKYRKYCVYTAVVDRYDCLKSPEAIDDEVEYICFSNSPLPVPPPWKVKPIEYFHPDPTRIARWVKLHPHYLLPEYEACAWVDANILLRSSLMPLLNRTTLENPFWAIPHPVRNCVYEEANLCMRIRNDDPLIISDQVKRYKKLKIPKDAGLIESNLFLIHLDSKTAKEFISEWWMELDQSSRRDQLSYVFAKHKTNFRPSLIFTDQTSTRNSWQFACFAHGTRSGYFEDPLILNLTKFIDPYETPPLFNIHSDSVSGCVIICVHNALRELTSCLNSALDSLPANWHILVVDDFSSADTSAYLRALSSSNPKIKLLTNSDRLGYTKSANIGLRKAKGDLIVLLNSDVIVPKNWLYKLIRASFRHPDLGIIGPMSNAASYQSLPNIKGTLGQTAINDLPKGMSIDDADALCERLSLVGTFPIVPLVHGFCFAIKSEVIKKIGLLDEKSFPMGYGEENDYCLRAQKAGFLLSVATDTYVFHHKSKSFNDIKMRIKLMRNGSKKLAQKHGGRSIQTATIIMAKHHLFIRMRRLFSEHSQSNERQG